MGPLPWLAFRNLTRNRRRTALTLAALTVGVTAVIGVRGFLNGVQNTLITSVAQGTVGPVVVHRKGWLANMEASPLTPAVDLDPALLARIAAVKGVTAVAPRIPFAAMVSLGDETVFATVTGVEPTQEIKACPKRTEFVPGGTWMKPDRPDALMGMELASGLGLTVGSDNAKVAVLASDVDGVLNAAEVDVVGSLAAAATMDKKVLLIPLSVAQELVRMPGRATELVVGVADLDDVELVRDRVAAALDDTYEVHTWMDLAGTIRDAREYQNAALGLVTTIFIFMMLLGIANTLLMSVLERVREVGTMMAVGARRRQIMKLFVWEALLLGVLGALIGAAVGTTVVTIMGAVGITLLPPGASLPQRLEPFIQFSFVARVVALSSVGAVLAALYPAAKASAMRPVDALGHV